MLRALGILGTPETPIRNEVGSTMQPTPGTPTTPSRRHTRHLDRSISRREVQRVETGLSPPPTPTDWPNLPDPSLCRSERTPRRSKRLLRGDDVPRTPESLPTTSPRSRSTTKRARGSRSTKRTRNTKAEVVSGKLPAIDAPVLLEAALAGPEGKIHLIQERLRHDPWRMLVAIYLLNKTTGRAANPIREQIFHRWPTAHDLAKASTSDLAELLYPLGLFNQRANSLIRFSQQYIEFGWPDPDVMDVTVFYGAGRYASDSFRIFSPLLPGRGAPELEARWLAKRERAILRSGVSNGDELGAEIVGEYMSDDGEDLREEEEEEWRKVRPTDKELRRYLIWRWGIEGILYDIDGGPRIHRIADRRRLRYLLQD